MKLESLKFYHKINKSIIYTIYEEGYKLPIVSWKECSRLETMSYSKEEILRNFRTKNWIPLNKNDLKQFKLKTYLL